MTDAVTFRRIAAGVYETQDGRYRVTSGRVDGHARSRGRVVWFVTDTTNPERRFESSESLTEARFDVADIIRRETQP